MDIQEKFVIVPREEVPNHNRIFYRRIKWAVLDENRLPVAGFVLRDRAEDYIAEQMESEES